MFCMAASQIVMAAAGTSAWSRRHCNSDGLVPLSGLNEGAAEHSGQGLICALLGAIPTTSRVAAIAGQAQRAIKIA
jgi:hypothetical protein